MRFYTQQHRYYCGIDLHARTICIIDSEGTVLFHRNMPTERGALLRAINSYRDDLVIAVDPGQGVFDTFQFERILFGLLIIGFLIFEPLGLYGIWIRVRNYWKAWPFSY